MKDEAAAGAAHPAGAAPGATAMRVLLQAGAVWLLALLGQALLIANPGYFSHDELQWAAFAGTSGPIPWVSWTDLAP